VFNAYSMDSLEFIKIVHKESRDTSDGKYAIRDSTLPLICVSLGPKAVQLSLRSNLVAEILLAHTGQLWRTSSSRRLGLFHHAIARLFSLILCIPCSTEANNPSQCTPDGSL
jgi:hypothetical protein